MHLDIMLEDLLHCLNILLIVSCPEQTLLWHMQEISPTAELSKVPIILSNGSKFVAREAQKISR
jgi:hypothetical protein